MHPPVRISQQGLFWKYFKVDADPNDRKKSTKHSHYWFPTKYYERKKSQRKFMSPSSKVLSQEAYFVSDSKSMTLL